jgi:hypothetical protein
MRGRAILLTAICMVGWLACGDSYDEGENEAPDGGPLVGDTGGKCFADGTCKAGLVCLSSLCVEPAQADGGGTDATPNKIDAGDAGVEAGSSKCTAALDLGDATQVACTGGNHCGAPDMCCQAAGEPKLWGCQSPFDCTSTDHALECDTPDDCEGDEQCCFHLAKVPGQCADQELRRSYCASSCEGDDVRACANPQDCTNNFHCEAQDVVLDGTMQAIRAKVCVQ